MRPIRGWVGEVRGGVFLLATPGILLPWAASGLVAGAPVSSCGETLAGTLEWKLLGNSQGSLCP